jgi:hypothetical protein
MLVPCVCKSSKASAMEVRSRSEWDAIPASIRKGSWCPYCVHNHKLKLEEMQQIARQRGGKCISKKYINNRTALVWECRRRHRWKALLSNVNRGPQKSGTWCLKCYNLLTKSVPFSGQY